MYRLKNRAVNRVEARSQGRATTGEEAVCNKAYELLQRRRGPHMPVWLKGRIL